MTFPPPRMAYDIDILHRSADRGSPGNHGWCFGLPPGIPPEHWPIDPITGYPQAHGFTLLIPEAYRVHGPEIVALSFFGPSDDHIETTRDVPGLKELVTDPASAQPTDPDLLPFWEAEHNAHPRLFRMPDRLASWFAVILLTRAEFDGPPCPPPPLIQSPLLSMNRLPPWLTIGHAAVSGTPHHDITRLRQAAEAGIGRLYGEIPDRDPAWHRALALNPRLTDPNAGKRPVDPWDGAASDYIQPDRLDENGELIIEAWVNDLTSNHIGGTMRPCQQVPRFSPFYIEFEEHLCGFNFGAGNAQLDFRDMKFDWACG